MKAIVIYERAQFALRALALLHRVAEQADVNTECSVLPWSVRALNEKEFARKALVEAQDAHLLVLPGKLARTFSVPLAGWVETWARMRHIPDAALGILDEGDLGAMEGAVDPILSEVALKYRLTLIEDGIPPTKPAITFDSEEQSASPAEAYQFGYFGRTGACRSFGINE